MVLNTEAVAAIQRKFGEKRAEKSKIGLLILTLALTVVVFITTALFVYYGMQVRNLKRKARAIERVFANIEKPGAEFRPLIGKLTIPAQLQTTPMGEKTGLVLGTKTIEVRNVVAPYNPSMIEHEGGYLLFFRYDILKQDCPHDFYTSIGCCWLDANFEQTEKEFTTIETGSRFSEDPRIVRVGSDLYLVFNDLQKEGSSHYRTMHVGKLNLKESKLEFSTDLDLAIKPVEKNWVPFEHVKNGKPELYIEYYLNPQKVMRLPNPEENGLVHLRLPSLSTTHKIFWPHLWGQPRGGATARFVDGQYLSFFHSFFNDSNGFPWYVMAAYTFEKEEPFRVTGISHYPILFEGIYSSPHMNTADPKKRVIFPGSFTEGTQEGKEVLYVCCGENDCSIKLIIMDKQVLFKSLKKL